MVFKIFHLRDFLLSVLLATRDVHGAYSGLRTYGNCFLLLLPALHCFNFCCLFLFRTTDQGTTRIEDTPGK